MKNILLLSLLFLSQNIFSQPPSLSAKKVHIYILAGQSNMAGRGTVEPVDTVTNPNILMLTKEELWAPAKDPVHFDKPVAGVGPGLSFAREMWAIWKSDPEAIVAIVPCAVGGTKIDLWQPGAYDNATKTYPWDDAIRRIKKALPDGTVEAILWHQGESDANEALSPSYENKLRALIAGFRKELNNSSLPFILGEIGEFKPGENKHIPFINSVIKKIAETTPYSAFVSCAGLTHRGDFLHFDAASAREFGKRYAAAYLAVKK
ncbi:MAG: sialate O-acetylesterase [Sediminibacterium sp.]